MLAPPCWPEMAEALLHYSPITLTNRAVIQPNSHTSYAYTAHYTTKLHTCTTNDLPQLNFEQQYHLYNMVSEFI